MTLTPEQIHEQALEAADDALSEGADALEIISTYLRTIDEAIPEETCVEAIADNLFGMAKSKRIGVSKAACTADPLRAIFRHAREP